MRGCCLVILVHFAYSDYAARFFYQRAQVILEVMAKLTFVVLHRRSFYVLTIVFSSAERKRRQIYRGDVHGQLPFDTKGMNDAVPSIDFSPSGGRDGEYSLERRDIDGMLLVE